MLPLTQLRITLVERDRDRGTGLLTEEPHRGRTPSRGVEFYLLLAFVTPQSPSSQSPNYSPPPKWNGSGNLRFRSTTIEVGQPIKRSPLIKSQVETKALAAFAIRVNRIMSIIEVDSNDVVLYLCMYYIVNSYLILIILEFSCFVTRKILFL